MPKTWWLKRTQICALTVLEARRQKVRCWQCWVLEALDRILPCLCQLLVFACSAWLSLLYRPMLLSRGRLLPVRSYLGFPSSFCVKIPVVGDEGPPESSHCDLITFVKLFLMKVLAEALRVGTSVYLSGRTRFNPSVVLEDVAPLCSAWIPHMGHSVHQADGQPGVSVLLFLSF